MNLSAKTLLSLVALLLTTTAAHAQAQRDLTEIGLDLYQRANSPDALARMRKDLVNAPEAYLISTDQPGTLVLLDKRRVRIPAMKYNVALHLLEARDSTGSHVWPPGSLDGFYLGRGPDARHFRSLSVRVGSTKTDFVEVLTPNDNSPVILGLQHHYLHEDAQLDPILRTETKAARTEIGQVIVAGLGQSKEPLRELSLNEKNVTKLFVPFASDVQAYAAKQHLSYTTLPDVLHLVEYFNRHSTATAAPGK
ncbi:hypothetical protein [Hymenobacter negativus]|uniref:Uncharacterized protein n=1 Tax=Hymenobacter negativus TaxID=2795026 RepID=A0ABS3QMD3_9BACT|nr:hypothetical protein [Hymenobacter negativus]MBO2012277.1 hypothetical protein [Hymenobacter negativus]